MSGNWTFSRFLVLLTFALLASACGSSAPLSGSSTTTTASTTTTTTLPSPVRLGTTSPNGQYSNLGAISRVAVVPLGAHAATFAAGSLTRVGVIGATKIGFRQFGSGPAILLVTGQHASMTWWDPKWLSTLAQHYTVTIFDPPGVGYSTGLERAISVSKQADLIAGLIDVLGLIKPVVAGWGLGGVLSLALAERHPKLLSRLVLIDPSGGDIPATRPLPNIVAAMASSKVTMAQLANSYFPSNAGVARAKWLAATSEVPADVIVAPTIANEAALQSLVYRQPGTEDGLRVLKVRTLIFVGALDQVAPVKNAIELARLIPRARLVTLENAGYAALFQDSQRFIEELEGFTK